MLGRSSVGVAAAACAAFVPLTIAACGADESGKAPSQILQDASTATRSVSTYHASGVGGSGSSHATFDLRIGGPGATTGSVTTSSVTVDILIVNGGAYIKGRQFLSQVASPQIANLVGDNWVKVPAGTASSLTQSFAGITDTKKLAGCLVNGLNGITLTKSTATLNGQPVVVLTAPALTLSFAASGPTYLLQLKSTGTTASFDNCINGTSSSSASASGVGNGGTVNFDSWGTAATVTPPAHPVDLSGG